MATKMKMQDGGPIDAMKKAMGQKPVSTKKTMKYVRKNGSGYIPSGNKGYDAYKKSAIEKTGSEEAARNTNMIKKNGGAKYKTGGMVNPNAKLQAAKTAGSKGVKSGVNPKAAASKVAKGRVGGTSVAPKAAIPKAIGSTKKYQDGGPTGKSPENQIKKAMIKNAFNNAMNTTKARTNKPVGKI